MADIGFAGHAHVKSGHDATVSPGNTALKPA